MKTDIFSIVGEWLAENGHKHVTSCSINLSWEDRTAEIVLKELIISPTQPTPADVEIRSHLQRFIIVHKPSQPKQ